MPSMQSSLLGLQFQRHYRIHMAMAEWYNPRFVLQKLLTHEEHVRKSCAGSWYSVSASHKGSGIAADSTHCVSRNMTLSPALSPCYSQVDKNSQSFKSVYTKAESLFERLEEIRTKFEPMMVLGLVGSGLEMENLIEQYLTEVKDWEMNFKVLKVKGREAETLPKYVTRLSGIHSMLAILT